MDGGRNERTGSLIDGQRRDLRGMDEGVRVKVSVPLDADGYFDRHCPRQGCGFDFKVVFEDWRDKVSDEVAFCPFCGYAASPSLFNTEQQLEYLKAVALGEIQRMIADQLRQTAAQFNRQAPRGFISMRLEVNTPPIRVPAMPEVSDLMRLRITCEACGCRFSVIGAAYFCPACGHNSAIHIFSQSLTRVRNIIHGLTSICAPIADRDFAAQVRQSLIESQLSTLVTAFQRFAEACYPKLPNPAGELKRNVFQRLDDGSRMWHEAGGTRFDVILGSEDYAALKRRFQQRHVLAHQEGIVDELYLTRSGDPDYAVGQRLVICETDVLATADLCERLAAGMSRDCGVDLPS